MRSETAPAKVPYTELVGRDNGLRHHSYEDEVAYFTALCNGDLDAMRRMSDMLGSGAGHLSDDPLKNEIYLFISNATLTTRYCIEGGLPPELAYMLSDLYIQQVDECRTAEDVAELKTRMDENFALRMKEIKRVANASGPVLRAMKYIFDNLGGKLLLADIARYAELSASRLAHLFSEETGVSLGNYIRMQRVEAAKEMLLYSSLSQSEIATQVGFSSQSHFISVFGRTVGMTPRQYAAIHQKGIFAKAEYSDENMSIN